MRPRLKTLPPLIVVAVAASAFSPLPLHASGKTSLARELTKSVTARTATSVGKQAARTSAARLTNLSTQYGDDAYWIVSKPDRLALFLRHRGEATAKAMIRHGEIVEPAIDRYGTSAAAAFANVTPSNARRLAILTKEGVFDASPQSPRLWQVVARGGDSAADFVWRNKAALSVSAGLAAFLANPDPFLSGGARLASVIVGEVVAPVADTAAKQFPWRPFWWLAVMAGTALFMIRFAPRFRRPTHAPCTETPDRQCPEN